MEDQKKRETGIHIEVRVGCEKVEFREECDCGSSSIRQGPGYGTQSLLMSGWLWARSPSSSSWMFSI